MDIRTHRIGEIINKILADPWPGTEGSAKRGAVAATKFWNWWGWGRKGPKGGGGTGDGDNDDGDGWEKHGGVPKPEAESECVDCFKW